VLYQFSGYFPVIFPAFPVSPFYRHRIVSSYAAAYCFFSAQYRKNP